MLVELSNYSIPVQIDQCFTQLGDKHITPVITHPERNPILQRSPQRVLQWIELGCVVQVTASALTGEWGEQIWRSTKWLFEHDAVHVLATDAHDTRRRKALVDDNPRAIVNGQPLPYFPNPVMKS